MAAPESDAFVFFGATGDLAYKKIFPALQALIRSGQLDMPIIGMARAGWTLDKLRERARDSLEHYDGVDPDAFAKLSARLKYVGGDYQDPDTYQRLHQALGDAKRPLHYLAIPPSMFAAVVQGLASAGCATNARVIVEKPFGRDLASAQSLDRTLHEVFPESAVFRIDHYLAKEAVQNLLYFRFANTLMAKGFPGEAKAVLDQGFAAKAIDKSRGTFTQLYALASTRSQGDLASLATSAAAARSSPDAKKAMVTAEAYYGYGEYAKAADLFRVALTKPGVDKDLANLRLGMSLLMGGDKAGAIAALNAAGGAQAEVAKLWLTYAAQKA